jgi:hypothetical protein
MDIFEIAQKGMEIQEVERVEKLKEAAEIEKTKAYKLEIFDVIRAAENKDYDWFNRLGENQKHFQPFMLNLWLGMLWNVKNTQKKFNNNDMIYAELIKSINHNLNRHVYNTPKELFWLLACIIQEYDAPFDVDYKKSLKKISGEKYNKKVIDYMSKELLSSKEKILDMIDMGLITNEDMIEIEKDLETLEDQRKKK